MKTINTLIVTYALIGAASVAGWVANIVWLLGDMDTEMSAEFVLALVGCLVFPLGALHGLWTLF